MASEAQSLIVELQVAISVAILAVLALRWPVRAAFGPGASYALWAAAPVAVAGALLPARIIELAVVSRTPDAPAGLAAAPADLAPATAVAAAGPSIDPSLVLLALWALGAAVTALIFAARQRRLRRDLGGLTRDPQDARVWHAQSARLAPMVLGVLRPRIVVPSDFRTRFTPLEQRLAIAHESAHLRGGDTRILAFVAAARCLFWFNPLVHWAAGLLRLDQERARDAEAARAAGSRREYGEALLKFQLLPGAAPLACEISAGADGLRRRLLALRSAAPGRARAALGGSMAALLCASIGFTAWASQAPRVVVRADMTAEPAADRSALAAAVRWRDIDLARRALEAGADPNAWRPGEGAPLIEATRRGDRDMAVLLLDHGADPNAAVPGDGTALIAAVRRVDRRMMALLLQRGADPNLSAPGDGNALTAASLRGEADIIQALIDHGADVNAIAEGDETPLINAARAGEVLAASLLIRAGADVNLAVVANRGVRAERRSPLGEAQRYGQTQVAAYLESKGARP